MNTTDGNSQLTPYGTTGTGFSLGPTSPDKNGTPGPPRNVVEALYREGYRFDFFQAVRLLEKMAPTRRPVGRQGTVTDEVVRFRVPAALDFPPSAIHQIVPSTDEHGTAEMWVNFMGLTGPSGILPRHYTEMLLRRHLDFRGDERYVLRDWFDLFNHRLISLFYRAWEKYRFWIAFDRGEHLRQRPDPFTLCLRSVVGLALPSLHDRLRVRIPSTHSKSPTVRVRELDQIDDLSVLGFAGVFSQRPRNALNLQQVVSRYFLVPVQIKQFQGQWLELEPDDQLQLGSPDAAPLGGGAVLGSRVWNIQGKFRVRLGPLSYEQFSEFFPDASPTPHRKLFFLLSQLVRLYVGPQFDFDVQLVLRRSDVPPTTLGSDTNAGSRLGWNTWLCTNPPTCDAEDAIIAGCDGTSLAPVASNR